MLQQDKCPILHPSHSSTTLCSYKRTTPHYFLWFLSPRTSPSMGQTLDPINPQQILLENTILGLSSESALPWEPSSCHQKGRAAACEFSCDLVTKKGERRGICLHGVPVAEHPHPISQTTDISCGVLNSWAPPSVGSSIRGLLHPWYLKPE